jgi:hypothetical protein
MIAPNFLRDFGGIFYFWEEDLEMRELPPSLASLSGQLSL